MKTMIKKAIWKNTCLVPTLLCFLLLPFISSAQFTETMGTVTTTTSIAVHETNNGFDYDDFTYSGSADVRTTFASPTGGANIFVNGRRYFQVCDIGVRTCGDTVQTLSFYV